MRSHKIRAAALLSLILLITSAAFGQRTVKLSSTPREFRDFYTKFAATVRRGDMKLLSTMTQFPFKYGLDAGNEGTWSRKEFPMKFGSAIMPQPLIFRDKNPEFQAGRGTYTLTDNDNASYFTFAKRGGTYKFISYIVEP